MENNNKAFSKFKGSKEIRLGKQTFEFLIDNNFLYIDKTKEIYKLLNNESMVFLSRPRRFGKSLLVSTLNNIFSGNKKLFEGFYIYDKWDWSKKYPVLHLDMSTLENSSNQELKRDLENTIETIADMNQITLNKKTSIKKKFSNLIQELSTSTGEKVVVLIDEYDTPILDNINDKKLADDNRRTLEGFYNVLKTNDEYIEFVLITGISKFAHTSIFSKLNNLTDISLLGNYAMICGIGHDELEKHCHDHIQFLADKEDIGYDEVLAKIDHWYYGYSFDGENRVFNPYSTLSVLKLGEFSQFWFKTGTPHFLVDILKNRVEKNVDFKNIILGENDLNEVNPLNMEVMPLLFQGGYLTIDRKFRDESGVVNYSLKIPNFEVEQAYNDNLRDLYLNKFKDKYLGIREQLWIDIRNGNCDSLARRLQADISWLPSFLNRGDKYNWKNYETVFLLWMRIMGFEIRGEKTIKHGRMDGVFEDFDDDHVVIVEVKYSQDNSKSIDKLVDEAFGQICRKEYWLPYEGMDVSLMALVFKDEEVDEDTVITRVRCKIQALKNKL